MVRRSTRTAKRAISSSSSETDSGDSNRTSSSQGSSTCTHRLRYFRKRCRSAFKSSAIGALSMSAKRRCCFASAYSERKYVSAPDTAVRIAPRYAPPAKARSHCLTISEHHSERITPPFNSSSSRATRYSHESCGSVFIGERFGSGDGERKTLLTRQIAFEPLPASVYCSPLGGVVAVLLMRDWRVVYDGDLVATSIPQILVLMWRPWRMSRGQHQIREDQTSNVAMVLFRNCPAE